MDAAPQHDHLVEGPRRLSRSLIWRLQRAFYARLGPAAWTTGQVPWFGSANAGLAQAYARVIDAFLGNVAAGAFGPEAADPARPVHVVDVGAGHGRFAFLVLEHLAALATRTGGEPRAPLRYVITDLAEANLAFCADHPALRRHLDAGRLDLAAFDAEHDGELRLRRAGVVLSPARPAGPIVVIANYLFDSLVTDVFRIEGGALHESLAAVHSTQPEPDLDDPGLLERLRLEYEHVPIEAAYYGDPALDAILANYRRTLADTAICFPIGALTAVRNLHRLAGGRVLLLTADKGFLHEDELLFRPAPQPVIHGSFSLSVNFHAIGAWFRQVGGHALDTTQRDSTLTATGFVAGAAPDAVARTHGAFADWIERFGPIDAIALNQELRPLEQGPGPGLAALLALLRLGDWDPWLFYQVADRLCELLDDADEAQRRAARRGLEQVWARYYHLGGLQDVPFELARVWQRLRYYDEAITCYRRSLALFGDRPVTHHNLGLCLHYGPHDHAGALAAFERALALDPDEGHAREWRLRMQAELRGTGEGP